MDGEAFIKNDLTLWGVWADDIVDQAKAAVAKPDAVLEPWTRYVSEHVGHKPARALHDALDYFAELSRRFDVFFQRYDLMLSPVLHSEAPPLGYLGPQTLVEVMVKRLHRYASYTPVHNAAGVPAMSVPLGCHPPGCRSAVISPAVAAMSGCFSSWLTNWSNPRHGQDAGQDKPLLAFSLWSLSKG